MAKCSCIGLMEIIFLTKGMALKVSCGGCNKYYGSSGYKSSLKEIMWSMTGRGGRGG